MLRPSRLAALLAFCGLASFSPVSLPAQQSWGEWTLGTASFGDWRWAGPVANVAALPAGAASGTCRWTVAEAALYCYTGAAWVAAGGGGVDTDDQTAPEVPYTPAVGADWTPDPTHVAGAADQLAERVTDLEGATDDDVPEVGDFGAFNPAACPADQWASDITAGALVCAQPSFANLSGTAAVAQLGTGTPSTATFLRGDGAWSSALTGGLTVSDGTTGLLVADGEIDIHTNGTGSISIYGGSGDNINIGGGAGENIYLGGNSTQPVIGTGAFDFTLSKLRLPNGVTAGLPATCGVGQQYVNTQTAQHCDCTATDTWTCAGGGGIGGSTGAVDNAMLAADGTGGATAQARALTVSDVASSTVTIGTTTANGHLAIDPDGTGIFKVMGSSAAGATTLEVLPSSGTSYTRIKDNGTVEINADSGTGTVPLILKYNAGDRFKFNYTGVFEIYGSSGNAGTLNLNGLGRISTAAAQVVTLGSAGGRTDWLQWAGQAQLAANGTNATATMASTGLSITVLSGRKYSFECSFFVSDSVAADGIKIDFEGGTAAATNFRAHALIHDSALVSSAQVSALATDITAATITGDALVEVRGSFEPSGNGTFIPRYAQNAHTTGTLTIYRGSHCTMDDMP